MFRGKKIIGIIPARGGSKGLPRKNILAFCGRPLITWTIERARACKYLDDIIVSTDDREIAAVSKKYGAEVPFLRPKRLAGNKSRMIDVIEHAVKYLARAGRSWDIIVLLQPTSPLRRSIDIAAAIEKLFRKKARAIVSVCPSGHHPLWSNMLPGNGSMRKFLRPEVLGKNRQELPVYYQLNGALYVAYTKYLFDNKGFLGAKTFAYIMPSDRSIDIDSRIDARLAELLLRSRYE